MEASEAGVLDVVDSTAVEVYRDPGQTLFRTHEPTEVIERATQVANVLAPVIEKRGLYAWISGKKHIEIEGWQTLGAMLGVTPVTVWTRQIENGWEARVEARTLDGRTIGAAESMCEKTEGKPWNTARAQAIRSMAQTRAASKALSSVLRFIVILAGYQGVSAEEMQEQGTSEPQKRPAPQASNKGSARPANANQRGAINGRMGAANLTQDEQKAILNWVGGVAYLDRLPAAKASELIDALKEDGSGAAGLLDDIVAEAQEGNARAQKIVERYFAKEPRDG